MEEKKYHVIADYRNDSNSKTPDFVLWDSLTEGACTRDNALRFINWLSNQDEGTSGHKGTYYICEKVDN